MLDLPLVENQTSLATLDFLEATASTNDRALELIRADQLDTPALVLTENQTAGRGQRDHKWWSGEGSLTFSFVCQLNPKLSSLVPLAAAVSVVRSIEATSPLRELKIKWPNDILVGDKKLSGILVESIPAPKRNGWNFVVVGIGINVNNKSISVSELETLDNRSAHSTEPTSILIKTGKQVSRETLLIDLVNRLENQFGKTLVPNEVVGCFNERLAFRGDKIRVQIPGGSEDLIGVCHKVNAEGKLLVESGGSVIGLPSGTVRRF